MDEREALYTTDRDALVAGVVPFLRRFKRDPPDGACVIVDSRPYMIIMLTDDLYYYDASDNNEALADFETLVDDAVRRAADARPGPHAAQNIE